MVSRDHGLPARRVRHAASPPARRSPISPRRSGAAWRRRRSRPRSTATSSTSSETADRRRAGAHHHRRHRRGARRPSPLDRPRPGPGGARLWPGARYAIGPAIADGFYYDFELPGGAHFTEDDLARIEAEMREIVAEAQPFVREEHTIRRGPRALRRPALQARDHRGRRRGGRRRSTRSSRRETGGGAGRRQRLPQRAGLRRPLPRPARALDRPARPLQADAGRRRLLARRRAPAAAAADLRDGVGVRQGARGPSAPPRGGRAARPPPARRRARPVLLPARDRLGAGGLPSRRAA